MALLSQTSQPTTPAPDYLSDADVGLTGGEPSNDNTHYLSDADVGIKGPKVETPSMGDTALHHAERGMLPAAGGWAGMAAGAKLGAVVGAMIPGLGETGIGEVGGAVVGGLVGGFGGGWTAGKAQQAVLDKIPEDVKAKIGQSTSQREAEELAHPYIAEAAELAPNLALMRPGAVATAAREGAGVLERTLSNPVGARAVGAGLMATQEAASEEIQKGEIDPGKVAIAAGAGALMNRETALGEAVRTGAERVIPGGTRVHAAAPTPEEAAAPVLAADTVDSAIEAAKSVTDRAPLDVEAMGAEAERQGKAAEAAAPPEEPVPAPEAAPDDGADKAKFLETGEAPTPPAAEPSRITPAPLEPAYSQAKAKAATYQRWLGELDTQRRQDAENSPQAKLLRQTATVILGKVNGVEERLTGTAAARLTNVRQSLDDLTNPVGDSPDMAKVRAAMVAEHQRMADAAAVRPNPDGRPPVAESPEVTGAADGAEPVAPTPAVLEESRVVPATEEGPVPAGNNAPQNIDENITAAPHPVIEAASRFTDLSPKEARTQAARFALDNLRGTYKNEDTGWDISLTGMGISKSLSGEGTKVRAEIVANLPKLLERGKLTESHPDTRGRPEIQAAHRFAADLVLDGRANRVKLTVLEDIKGAKRHYAVDHVEVEPAGKLASAGVETPTAQTGSEGNIRPEGEAFNTAEKPVNSSVLPGREKPAQPLLSEKVPTRSVLVKEPSPPPVSGEVLDPKPRALSLKAIDGGGNERERAINGEIYRIGEEAPQKEAADRLVAKDYDHAVAVALRQKQPPAGVHPEFVFMAVEAKATRDGDVTLIQRLNHSRLAEEATIMGQRIGAWKNRDPLSAVAHVNAVENARARALESRGLDATKEKAAAVKEVTQQIKAATKTAVATRPRQTWETFISSITCAGE